MSGSKPYHHGNLREVLLDAAIGLIAEVGPAGFTLREVARRAGVSHNAPYRHFADRDALMAAVAVQGFRELTEAMREAAAAAVPPGDSRERLKQAGLAYVQFALRRPEHFTVMFDAPNADSGDAGGAAAEAFETLLGLVKNWQKDGRSPEEDPKESALLAWTMVHGVAKLAITGRLPYRSRAAILRFTAFVIDRSLPDRTSRLH